MEKIIKIINYNPEKIEEEKKNIDTDIAARNDAAEYRIKIFSFIIFFCFAILLAFAITWMIPNFELFCEYKYMFSSAFIGCIILLSIIYIVAVKIGCKKENVNNYYSLIIHYHNFLQNKLLYSAYVLMREKINENTYRCTVIIAAEDKDHIITETKFDCTMAFKGNIEDVMLDILNEIVYVPYEIREKAIKEKKHEGEY